ncbi:NADH-quinone oxidoreductase subunit N [Gillisia sp. Hel_I_86]|uniref:NADH-quinone oxidoreductase subunit N n=1 Tax=Gillisia sp. Hel_I_86 TaxID=1249981 RepID=UPI00119A943E|nr:NADH-quinone oxidoreductase subunit N [Gillisia sp. Hel_I_86]TVZ28637.1 NADH-quinone oxidoreductase subunit N [Gillisia sp. Hel_I_86]
MSAQDIMSLLPVVILAGGILFILLLVAVKRDHLTTFAATLLILTASLITVFFTSPETPHVIGELFLIDRFGYYYLALILLATLVVAIFSYLSLRDFFPEKRMEEYYLLLMLATLGSAMMVFSTHFISFFVSLEILSVSLYALIAYYRERTKAIEAGLKYLMLAAMSSSFLLLGMALVYAISGTMAFHSLASISPALSATSNLMLIAGIALMIVGIGFKLAAVPFHMWTPDVYEGASSPISAFIATVSKGSIVALLLRFFILADLYRFEKILWAFTVISILSMLIGNLLALMQNNVKRILAYSSIAHFGYLLVALIAGKEMGPPAATFYLTVYVITILAAFGIISLLSQSQEEATDIEDYRGLFWKRPFLAAAFTVSLLSLAGIPITAGFIGKFFVLTAGVGTAKWLLAFTLVIGSVIGLYYYLQIIVVMMKQEINTVPTARFSKASSLLAGSLALIILTVLMIWIGVYPRWLVDIVNSLG